MPVEKISVTIDRGELKRARAAALRRGLSLSAILTKALHELLEEEDRQRAAAEIIATFGPEDHASPEEQERLLKLWTTPRREKLRRRKR